MPYDATDKSAKLALAFGEHAVHNGNGKLIRHEAVAVGSDLQVKFQTALGLGEWDSCVRLTYDGVDIPAQNFEFYPNGAPAGASALFPTDVAHAGAAHTNVNLPVGMSQDNDPDKMVGRFKTSKTADYDAAGNSIGFGYSTSPARAAAHAVKLLTGETSLIEFGSFDQYKSWCAGTIPITKDGVTVQIPRFELHAFFLPPFSLKQILDRICSLSCTDWQWRRGKIRFMPAVARSSEFTFDLSKLAIDFSFQTLTKKNRPNGIRVLWRDFDNALLKEADPIIIKRQNLIDADDGIENFYEFNAGVCRRSQAERLANYLAKIKCDLLDFAQIRGSWKSYFVLPGDLVTLSHTTPDWTNKLCKVIKKVEDEDRGVGYPFTVQLQPTNPYSDTDQTPLTTRTPVVGLNPYAAPPLPVLTVQQDSALASDGSTVNSIAGTVNFGSFGFGQSARVYWMKPNGNYVFLTNLQPDSNNSAAFRVVDPPQGANWFKVIPVSELNVSNQNLSTSNQKLITIAARTFYIDGFPVSLGVFRALKGLDPQGKYIGRDTGVVPVAAIAARIDSADIVAENVWCVVAVSLNDLAGGAHNQADSASAVQVDVFDQFGTFIKSFPPAAISLKAATAVTSFPRKYADPSEGQAFFRIKILNNFGWSNVVYLQKTTVSAAMPLLRGAGGTPRELTAAPVGANVLQMTFQCPFNSNLYRRFRGELNWTLAVYGVAASPVNITGLSESTDYEFILRNADDDPYSGSNIASARTKQQSEAAPTRPAPTSLSGSPNSTSPTTQINTSWVRNAPDNVNVEIWKNGALVDTVAATQTCYNFTGLTAGTSYTFKVRNKWGTSDYSQFSNEITVSTQATASGAPAAAPPEIISASYDTTAATATASFTAHGGAGTYQTEFSVDGGAWTIINTALSASATQFSVAIAQSGSAQKQVNLRLRRNDVSGYSNEFIVVVPILQSSGGNSSAPQITGGGYDTTASLVVADFTPHGGAGTYQTEYKINTGAWTIYTSELPAAATGFAIPIAQSSTASKSVNLRIKRSDVADYSLVFNVVVPINQLSSGGGGGVGGGCFTGLTEFCLSPDRMISFAELYARRAEFVGTEVLSFTAENHYTLRKILDVFRVKSNKFVIAKFSNGLTRKVTPKHRFWTSNREFVSICNLKAGDKVYDKDFNLVEIVSVKLKTVKKGAMVLQLHG